MGRRIVINVQLDLSKPGAMRKLEAALARGGGKLAQQIARAASAAAPRDTGQLGASFKVKGKQGRKVLASIITDAEHFAPVEGGSDGKAPTIDDIRAWIKRKKIKPRRRAGRRPLKGKAAVEAVAFLIARSERRSKATRFYEKAQRTTVSRKARRIMLGELRGLRRELG